MRIGKNRGRKGEKRETIGEGCRNSVRVRKGG